MHVSVVVASAGIDSELRRLISSLEAQSLPPEELVIVTPESSHDVKELVKSTKLDVKIIELRKDPGPIRARIFGGISSRGCYVAFIDSDCVAPPDWLERMMKEMLSEQVDVIAGSVTGINLEKVISRAQEYSLISPNPKHSRKIIVHDIGVNLLVTANVLLRRDVLLNSRIIPPSYGRYGFEDLDFFYRITKAGYKILCSPVSVFHYNRTRFTTVLKRYFEYGCGLPLFRRHSRGCVYSKVITLLSYSLMAILTISAALLILGNLEYFLAAVSLIFVPLHLYHLSKIKEGKAERLVYPYMDFLLALTASLGALIMEAKLLLLKVNNLANQ
ncbi:MAG: glycosyltransferase [Thermofilaceae archaeon]|nr:glycosyltransferase [Thermofilaceae archaeon]MCX8181282.1 glycosyltransferase [Thermofilaceae archaeon]MDW8004625.1 glycosyltransferase [Thermofilaceae archaeon]